MIVHDEITLPTGQMAASSVPPARAVAADPENRRVHKRHKLEVEIDVTSEHNFYAGVTSDLSLGGVFVATALERPVGTLVDLALKLPGSAEPLRCIGEVRWHRPASEQAPAGLGIRFVLLQPGAKTAIQRFLEERDPVPVLYDE